MQQISPELCVLSDAADEDVDGNIAVMIDLAGGVVDKADNVYIELRPAVRGDLSGTMSTGALACQQGIKYSDPHYGGCRAALTGSMDR